MDCIAPGSAESPGDKMCSLHTTTVSCPLVAVQMSHQQQAIRLVYPSAGTVCMHSLSASLRTDPIAAAARRAVELLAFEADDKGWGRGKVRKGVERVVASVTGPVIELAAGRAVWYVRARVGSCAGMQNSSLCQPHQAPLTALPSLYQYAHTLRNERTSLSIYDPHSGQNAAQGHDSMGQLHGARLVCKLAKDARIHRTASAPGQIP